ncbi:hypothetical protein AMTRI_Chr11g152310 [Amborella trichopoda]
MISNNDGRNHQWISPQDDKLLTVIALCIKDKLRTNGVFCRKGWASIMREMCDEYGPGFDRTRIKNRLRTLKTNYANVKKRIREYGFGWIDDKRMVTADWAVWEEYCAVYTNNTTFYYRYLLCDMCPYVHFAWLFYRTTTFGHQNTRARASLL